MNIATASDYFALGLLDRATVRAPFMSHDGWTVEIGGNIGNADPLLRTSRGQVRLFRTLDAAANAVRSIGFRQFDVVTD